MLLVLRYSYRLLNNISVKTKKTCVVINISFRYIVLLFKLSSNSIIFVLCVFSYIE